MVAAPLPGATGAHYAPHTTEAERLAGALLAAVLHDVPQRLALMKGPGSDRKYSDAPKGHQLDAGDMVDHLAARRTWAAALPGRDGLAVAGCRDYDGDEGQGATLGLAALAIAEARGLSAAAIILGGRAHVWAFYRRPAPAADIRHQLATLLPAGDGECYPSGNAIRLPLGYHRRKLTRGELVLQDGRRFDLDRPGQVEAGLRALLALQRNAAPPEAPAEVRQRASGSAAPPDPAAWAAPSATAGAALMASGRYRALFARRPQLRMLAAGRRVILPTAEGFKDTGSEQLAALVVNLLTTGRSDAAGRFVPGLGAPPLAEIRAVALHWHATLRPGQALGAYQADVDRLIGKYLPAGYEPEVTRGAGLAIAAGSLPELPPARHRGRPAGAQVAQVERCAGLLAPGALVTRSGLAVALGCDARSVTRYLSTLRSAGRVELSAEARGLRVVRVDNKSIMPAEAHAAQQEAAAGAEGGQKPIAAEGGQPEPIGASQSGAACMREHTAPLGLPVAPPAAEPVPWGSDDERAALARELLAAGWPGRAAFVARGLVDDARRAALLAELRPLVEAEAQALDVAAVTAYAAALAAQALRDAQASAPRPALTIAGLVSEAIDAYGSRLGRVRAYVAANGGAAVPAAAVERAYRAELRRRKYARADEQRRRRYARMELPELQKRRRSVERHIAQGLAPFLPPAVPADFRDDLPDAERLARWAEKRAARVKARKVLPVWQREHTAIEAAIAAKLPQMSAEAEEAALFAELDRDKARSPRPSTGRRPAVTLRKPAQAPQQPAQAAEPPPVCSPLPAARSPFDDAAAMAAAGDRFRRGIVQLVSCAD